MELYLLLITIILSVVQSEGSFCSRLPSGLGRLRNGVDVTKLDLLPLDQRVDNGFRTPIIDFTCAQKKTIDISGVSRASNKAYIFQNIISKLQSKDLVFQCLECPCLNCEVVVSIQD